MTATDICEALTTASTRLDAVGKTISIFPKEECVMSTDFVVSRVRVEDPWIIVTDKDSECELRVSDDPAHPMMVLYRADFNDANGYEVASVFFS